MNINNCFKNKIKLENTVFKSQLFIFFSLFLLKKYFIHLFIYFVYNNNFNIYSIYSNYYVNMYNNNI